MNIPRHWQFSLLMVLAVLVVFWPVGGFDFLYYDDRVNVRDNPLVRDFSADSFLEFWRRPYEGLYIPLTYIVWGMLGKIAGGGAVLDPAPFHVANLLLHMATVTALYSLLRLLVNDDWAAAGGALLFALHPLVVEPVAWVSELKGLLSGFLSVMALRQYLLYGTTVGNADHWPGYRRYLLATLFFAAAVLAKPSALVLPLQAGLLGYLSQSRPGKDLLHELLPWLVMALPVAIITKYAQPDSQLPFVPDLWERVLVAGHAMGFYFLKLVWPLGLAPDYGQIPSVVLASNRLYLIGLFPWFLLCAAMVAQRVRSWLVVVSIPFCFLLPVLGFIPFTFQGTSTVADRYVYLGLIGPALGVAMLLARHRGRVVRLGMVAILIGLAVASSNQLRHWRDTPTLKWHMLKVNPNSWVANHNLGMYFREQNQLDAAVEHYKKAIKIKPGFYLSYFNLGYVSFLRNDLAGAAENFQKVVRMKPDFIPAYNNLGAIYQKQGLTSEAIMIFEKAVAVKPDFPQGYLALGRLYALLKRQEESAVAYRKALALKPAAEVFNEFGLLCLALGRLAEAESAFGKALALGYDSTEGLAKLAAARAPLTPPPPEGY
jgi:Tfp pilus assembly protein PilF